MHRQPVRIVFSDLDGTLVHYAPELDSVATIRSEDHSDGTVVVQYREGGEEVPCVQLPSRTQNTGYLSCRSVELIGRIRRQYHLPFVLLSGSRSSTFFRRLPRLPEVDAFGIESGGRLFYRDADGDADAGVYIEDRAWAETLAPVAGLDWTARQRFPPSCTAPLSQRPGRLWRLAESLEREGWRIDAHDFFTAFRMSVSSTAEELTSRFQHEVQPRLAEYDAQTAYNLGKADVFPVLAGKRRAAQHFLRRFQAKPAHAAALFDDDNDLAFATLCGQAYVPTVTHPSVEVALAQHPHWRRSTRPGPLGTEQALEWLLQDIGELVEV
eukprot:ctg_1351.g452